MGAPFPESVPANQYQKAPLPFRFLNLWRVASLHPTRLEDQPRRGMLSDRSELTDQWRGNRRRKLRGSHGQGSRRAGPEPGRSRSGKPHAADSTAADCWCRFEQPENLPGGAHASPPGKLRNIESGRDRSRMAETLRGWRLALEQKSDAA